MNDISELLRAASVEPSDLDLDRVHRDGRRRQRRPRTLLAAIAVAAVLVAGTVFLVRDDADRTPSIAPATTEVLPTVPSTSIPSTTVPATTVPTPSTPPEVTVPPGEDRLSSSSRLGYAGLGPIKLGMEFDLAAAAAQVRVGEVTGCEMSFYGAPDSGVNRVGVWGGPGSPITSIEIDDPAISTISGIHVGSSLDEVRSTYPGSTDFGPDRPGTLFITNPEGRVIVFSAVDGIVTHMSLAFDLESLARHAQC
jgi:hypothetical protein